jgi:DNA polymerase III epsilon subunit family exonuclease
MQEPRSSEEIATTFRVQTYDVVFDLETSGLSIDSGEIIAIEAIKVPATGPSTQRFYALVKPSKPLSSQVEEITGITNAMLDNQSTFLEVVPEFIAFIGNAQLFTVNAGFDQRFLDHQLASAGLHVLSAERIVDMLSYLPLEHRGPGIQGIVEYAASQKQEKSGLTIEVMEMLYRKLFRSVI